MKTTNINNNNTVLRTCIMHAYNISYYYLSSIIVDDGERYKNKRLKKSLKKKIMKKNHKNK